MAGGLLSLKWNQHRSTFLNSLTNIKQKELYSDITLACDGKYYEAHRLVLSACSEFFEGLFERTKCKHPVVVLKDVSSEDLESLLSYMYDGEVNVLQENLSCLIKAAECLKIKGLAVPDTEPKDKVSPNINKSHKNSSNVNNSYSQQSDNSSSVRNYKTSTSSSSGVKRQNNFSSSNSNFKQLDESQPSKKRKQEISQDNDSIYEPSESEKLPVEDEKEAQPTPDETVDNNNTFAEDITKETGVKAEPIEVIDDDIEDVTDAQESNDQHDYDGANNDDVDFTSEEKYIQHEEDTNSLWGNLENDSNDMYAQASTSSYGGENNVKPGTSSASVSGCSIPSLLSSMDNLHNLAQDPQLISSQVICDNNLVPLHNNISTLTCGECSITCADANSFFEHRTSHNNAQYLHCPYCNYKTYRLRREHMLTHIRRHTGERPFSCQFCAKSFASKCDLNTHEKLHGEKTYACSLCPYKAHRRSSVRVHSLNAHGNVDR